MPATIVCGVDGSPESLEAARQADVLLEPGGRLVLVSAVDLSDAIHFQVAPTAVHAARHAMELAEQLDRASVRALEEARAALTPATDVAAVQASGSPSTCLLETAAAERADLIAVGTHGVGRLAGIVLGSVATRMLHRAPCSVLVARRPAAGDWRPHRLVAGTDGSPEAEAAVAEARRLAERLGGTIHVVTIEEPRTAHALVEAAFGADLLVVGSRGVHGARSLGSVSERVAHEASCSVLVVRDSSVRPDPE